VAARAGGSLADLHADALKMLISDLQQGLIISQMHAVVDEAAGTLFALPALLSPPSFGRPQAGAPLTRRSCACE
jgi:hypothetical protein